MTPSSFTRAYVAHDLGGDLHRLAQRAAVVAAALYVAGLAVGVVIHWANDWLSGDRRPWPVAGGAAAAPRPRLREIYSRLAMKTETTMGTASPVRVLKPDPIVTPAAAESTFDETFSEYGRAFARMHLCDPTVTIEVLERIAVCKGIKYVGGKHLYLAEREDLVDAILDAINYQ
jgi:hypothetical protein